MFDSVGTSANPSVFRRATFLVVAIGFHVGLILFLWHASQARAEAPEKAPVKVTFYQQAPPPPPPPPPPAAHHHKKHHKKTPQVHPKTHQLIVPKDIPKDTPKADDSKDDDVGVEGGVEGGVVGGVVGGVLGGVLGGQLGGTGTGEPAPVFLRPGMTPPQEIDPRACRPQYPKAANAAGITGIVITEYTVTRHGTITDVQFKRGPKVFYGPIRQALAHCHMRPALNKGTAISVRMIRNFRFEQTTK